MGMAKIPIPQLVNGIPDEFRSCPLSRFLGGKVTNKDGVFGFAEGMHNGRGVVGNGGVRYGKLWIGKAVPHVAV